MWTNKRVEDFTNQDWLDFLDACDKAGARLKSMTGKYLDKKEVAELKEMDLFKFAEAYPFESNGKEVKL